LEHRRGPAWEGKAARIAALALLAIGVPSLLALFVSLFPDRRPTPMLVLCMTSYKAPCPPNAFAAEDAARFEQVYTDYDNLKLTIPPTEPRSSSDFLNCIGDFLASAQPGGPGEEGEGTVLIYLSAHGVVNDQGQPCLLLPNHNPLDAQTWLPVKDLLATLSNANRPRAGMTVLLLDANRVDDAWRMGVVENTFTSALERLLVEAPPQRCAILSAASGLQQAVAGPEISGTPFGYFAARGLRGDADAEGDADEIVSLHELANYLGKHVDAWTSRRRGVRQQPRCLTGGDFELKLADVAGAAEVPVQSWKSPIDQQSFQWSFEEVEQLERARAYASSPLEWAKVQDLLERLDAESLAGKAYAPMARDTFNSLKETLNDLKNNAPHRDLKPFSLAMRDRLGAAPPAPTLEAAWPAWLKDRAKTQVPAGNDAAASFIWSQFATSAGSITSGDVKAGLEFCESAGKASHIDFTEIALLRLLKEYADWNSPALKAGAPRRFLAARRESENMAAPEDPRQHYVLAPRMAPRDEALATALDQILIGDEKSLPAAERTCEALLGDGPQSYRQAELLSESVLRALKARDDALAVALPLSQWLVRRAEFQENVRNTAADHQLVYEALELSTCLDKLLAVTTNDDRDGSEERLQTLTEKVESATQLLQAQYAKRLGQVAAEEGGSPDEVALESQLLLRCPLQIENVRSQLHENWFAAMTQQSTDDPKDSVGDHDSDGPAQDEHDLRYLRWLAMDGLEPLRQAIDQHRFRSPATERDEASTPIAVDEDSSRNDVELALADLGGRIRRRIRVVDNDCRRLCDPTAKELANRPSGEARLKFSQADLLCRAMGPLAGDALGLGNDEAPTAMLQRLDTQAWIVWQGNRLLDDCWGLSSSPFDAPSYFLAAAKAAIDDAEQLFPEAHEGVSRLRSRSQELETAVKDWQPLTAKDLFVDNEGAGVVDHSLTFRGSKDLRPGQAAVFLTDERGELLETHRGGFADVRRVGVSMFDNSELDRQLDAKLLGNAPVLYVNALFRGHVKQSVFSVGRGVLADWQKPEPSDATIVVSGDSKQISQVIFIVDCSLSMEREGRARLKRGREVLGKILTQLVEQGGQFHVGLILYGRRAGWIETPQDSGHYEVNYLDPKSFNGAPGNDVEVVFEPQILNKAYAAKINGFLATTKALGETPLYLSLLTALDRFSALPGSRHIIAITDGVNDVAVDSRFPVTARTAQDILKALANHAKTRIDVIEFGVDANNLDKHEREIWPTGQKELKAIAESPLSGGKWTPAKDADDLKDVLLDSLRLDRYRVHRAGADEEADPQYFELGSTTTEAPKTPTNYFITLQTHDPTGAEIQIEGGEAVEVIYRPPPENRLVYPIYGTGKSEADDIRETKSTGDFLIASHVPLWHFADPDPVFRISIQSGDETRFSRRPQVIWARIEPQDEESPRSYYFLDRVYEPGLPVPMLNLRARGWSGWDFARIDLSFAMDADALPAKVIPIPKVGSDQYEVQGVALKVKSELAGEGYQVVVDEKHPVDGEHYPLHIQLDPTPNSISRTFFESKQNHSVHHVFRYDRDPSDDPALRVLTRSQIEAAGVTVEFKRVRLPRR
jgi:Mg-chelatase subunit ChlD